MSRSARPSGIAFVLLTTVALPVFASEQTPVKWAPYLDLEGKPGSKRNLGEADLFLPLTQSSASMLFADLRGRWGSDGGQEGNFGLGARRMLDSGWNIGGYGFFDRRRSDHGNYFNQITLGIEALSQDWDLRANGYLPVGTYSYTVDSLNTATLSGTSIIFRNGLEQSMGGFDGEIGWRVPLFGAAAQRQLRIYAGGYRFARDGMPTVQGPRGRVDLTFDEVPGLWRGSRLSLGLEVQHDAPRGTQTFGLLRLRIPLERLPGGERPTLSPMERRMTDPVVRDVDVVTQAGSYGAPEIVTQTASGQNITVVDSNSTSTTSALQAALNTAGAGTVILSGTFNTNAAIQMSAGQTIIGRGSLSVRSPSGHTATLTTPGATISAATDSTLSALIMNNGTTLDGVTVTNTYNLASANSVNAQGYTGVTIENSTISAGGSLGDYAIDALSSTNMVVSGNTISAKASGGSSSLGIRAEGANNITIAGNTFDMAGALQYVITGNNTTVFNTAASIGNVTNSGTCIFIGGAPTGTVGFTGGMTCP